MTASMPTYGVFKGAQGRSYVAYNPSAKPVEVSFSDGQKLQVGARSLGLKVVQ